MTTEERAKLLDYNEALCRQYNETEDEHILEQIAATEIILIATTPKDLGLTPPTTDFDCEWCKEWDDADIFTYPPDEFGGWCRDTNQPICINCMADAEHDLEYEQTTTKTRI